MKISRSMGLESLVMFMGGATTMEAGSFRTSLVSLHDGEELDSIPTFIVSAHINNALSAMPAEIPGEFFK